MTNYPTGFNSNFFDTDLGKIEYIVRIIKIKRIPRYHLLKDNTSQTILSGLIMKILHYNLIHNPHD